ncbi:MAG: aldehyde dehydrogenase family protein [Candidatus Methanomethylophilaceae archaeon]|nr:aldehyde dehydrogenase family protein [Candidatus Methanomethylophilaceae archaeon]
MSHIWRGRRVESFKGLLPGLDDEIGAALGTVLGTGTVLAACDRLCGDMAEDGRGRYVAALEADGAPDPGAVIDALVGNLSPDRLREKLVAELGTTDPMAVSRTSDRHQRYEAWKPMGVLVHVTAGNSPIVAPMALVEGLLSGNINIMKVASDTGEFAVTVAEALCAEPSIAERVYMLRFPSSDRDTLTHILDRADCVSAWGGEEAIESLRKMAPRGVPFVAWGHKISFAYIEPGAADDDLMDDLAADICRNGQQSCSSPQCVLVDTDSRGEVDRIASMLGAALDRAKSRHPMVMPDDAQAAEVTAVTQVHRCDLFFNPGDVLEDPDRMWRILVSYGTLFTPSPLFRTVWLSPLPRADLVGALRGMRQYLQTAGVACSVEDLDDVSDRLFAAGVDRVTPVGSMGVSYTGEPHDGGYALPRFMRRVSLRTDLDMAGVVSFDELRPRGQMSFDGPIQGKGDYPPVPDDGTKVLMKSGGTTGEPVYCSYTAEDFENYIVRPSVKSLLAGGIDPETDVVADLLRGGNLYGGLNAFISVFDRMSVPHLNIGGLEDTSLALHYAIRGRATVLLSAPSYAVRMIRDNEETVREYGRIRKLLYGGEMITDGQRAYLESMGVEVIRSALYGANETGSMGYQCPRCEGNVYHLHSDIQHLEIVATDSDTPVGEGEVGRMLFTGYRRVNGRTERYDIGDLGRWVPGRCPCGRAEPRFELMGRHGDVVRAGGTFFNFHRIAAMLSDGFGYRGSMQIVMDGDGLTDRMTIRLDGSGLTTEEVARILVDGYDSFAKTLPHGLMSLRVEDVGDDGFIMNTSSIKLRNVVDRR